MYILRKEASSLNYVLVFDFGCQSNCGDDSTIDDLAFYAYDHYGFRVGGPAWTVVAQSQTYRRLRAMAYPDK